MRFLEGKKQIYLLDDDTVLGTVYFEEDDKVFKVKKVEVEEYARGKGIAQLLCDYVFNKIINEGKKAKLICSYSVHYYEKNKDKYPNLQVIS